MHYFVVVDEFIRFVALLIQYIGLFMVAGAVIVALIKLPMKEFAAEEIRVNLAKNIIFALEFIIAGDILHATLALSFQEVIQLGAIVIIRIMLGYALRKEVGRK